MGYSLIMNNTTSTEGRYAAIKPSEAALAKAFYDAVDALNAFASDAPASAELRAASLRVVRAKIALHDFQVQFGGGSTVVVSAAEREAAR